MFYIVEFQDSPKVVAIVPRLWLNISFEICSWPPTKDPLRISKLVRKCIAPEEGWQQYNVRPLHAFPDYETAKSKLNEAENTSNLSSDGCAPLAKKRKIKKKTLFSFDEGSSSDTVDQALLPHAPDISPITNSFNTQFLENTNSQSLISHIHYPQSTRHASPHTIQNSPVFHASTPHSHSSFPNTSLNMPSTSHHITHDPPAFHPPNTISHAQHQSSEHTQGTCPCCKLNTHMIKHIQKQVDSIVYMLQQQLGGQETSSPDCLPPTFPVSLPITSVLDLASVNDWLDNNSNFAKAAAYFQACCGSDTVKKTVSSILRMLIKKDLAIQFNWKGRGEKNPFCIYLKLQSLIYYVAKKNGKLSEGLTTQMTNEVIKSWLRFAPDRDGGRGNRATF